MPTRWFNAPTERRGDMRSSLRRLAVTCAVSFTGVAAMAAVPGFGADARARGDAGGVADRLLSSCAAPQFTSAQARHVLRVAEGRLLDTNAAFRPGTFPVVTDQAGRWRTGSAQQWTSGFFPGSLWLAYRHTGRPAFLADARAWTQVLAGRATDTSTHDIG